MQLIAPLSLRTKINVAEEAMLKMPLASENNGFGRIDLKIEHQFSFGVYARTVYIPKGITLVGHIHKFENLNILLKGKLQVSTGEQIEIVEPPFSIVSPPNTKRIAYALEDSIWMTIHGTHERDLNIIEDYFIAHNEEEYLEFSKKQLALPGF